ncbi:MAG: hypothetical protein HY827_10585 [Actinobacteria bacterium]|nr:hypothetical protein [Actinomycetota bacterium]
MNSMVLGAHALNGVSTRINERALKFVLVCAVVLVYLVVIPISAYASLR